MTFKACRNLRIPIKPFFIRMPFKAWAKFPISPHPQYRLYKKTVVFGSASPMMWLTRQDIFYSVPLGFRQLVLNIIVHNKSLKTTHPWIYYTIIYMSTLPTFFVSRCNKKETFAFFVCLVSSRTNSKLYNVMNCFSFCEY